MDNIKDLLQKSISECMSAPVGIERWRGASLMHYLQGEYEFFLLRIAGIPCLMLASRDGLERPPGKIRKHMRIIAEKAHGVHMAFACRAMSPTNRSRFVQAGIPFIVPGARVHLPFLGASESASRLAPPSRKTPTAFDAITQQSFLVATASKSPVSSKQLADAIGCSKMSVSRAMRAISDVGLGRILADGREHLVALYGKNGFEAFKSGLPYMRSPVAAKFIAYDGFPKDGLIPAGESALAEISDLAEPAHPVFAASRDAWLDLARRIRLAAVHDADTVEIEVWRYRPRPVQDPVGALSVCLSLMDIDDARLEDAIDTVLASVLADNPF